MKVVVCDTGPILHLQEAALLGLLAKAGEVLVPPAVDQEMKRHIPGWLNDRPGWLQVVPVPDADMPEVDELRSTSELDVGEAKAVVLAQSVRADWLLTDDARARLVGSLRGLEVHGSLGVVLWAATSGHLNRTEGLAALHRLSLSSLWVSANVLREAREFIEGLSS